MKATGTETFIIPIRPHSHPIWGRMQERTEAQKFLTLVEEHAEMRRILKAILDCSWKCDVSGYDSDYSDYQCPECASEDCYSTCRLSEARKAAKVIVDRAAIFADPDAEIKRLRERLELLSLREVGRLLELEL